MERKTLRPFRGMNSDKDLNNIPEGESRTVSNMFTMTGLTQQENAIPAWGNQEINNANLPSGVNTTIHSIEDLSDGAMYYFVHNSNGFHSIWRLSNDFQNPVFTKVLEDSLLQFQLYMVVDADIKDGLLYWTQGYFNSFLINANGDQQYAPPRKLNIQQAIDYTAGSGGYSSMDWQTLEVIKYPPESPSVSYATDPGRKTNNLRGRLFQFRLQYIYDDNEESRWSPISKLATPTLGETMGGEFSTTPELDNRISLSIPSGHHTVSKIRVAVREGNTGAWGIFREIDKDLESVPDNLNIGLQFYNDEKRKAVEIKQQNYDLVPFTADTQELLTNNEIAYAGIREGQNRIQPDMSCSYSVLDLPIVDSFNLHEVATNYTIVNQRVSIVPNYGISGTGYYIPSGTVFTMVINNIISGDSWVTIFQTTTDYEGVSGVDSFMVAWESYLSGLSIPPTFAVVALSPDQLEITAFNGTDVIDVDITIQQPNPRYSSWKKGAVHPIGVQYYDEALRDGTVITNEDSRIYVKAPGEEHDDGGVLAFKNYRVRLTLSIDHVPPEWAKYYQVVYAKNQTMISFQQRSVRKIEFDNQADGRVKISLERSYRDSYPGATYNHEIKEGDVVRLITKIHPVAYGTAPYVDGNYEFTVKEYSPDSGEANSEAIWVENFNFEGIVDGNEAFLIEIHTPTPQEPTEEVWFEIGEVFEVVDPYSAGRRHVGQVVGVTPATIDLDEGDVYIRRREMGTGFTTDPFQKVSWYVEDFHYSDYRLSDDHNYGRIGIQDVRSELKYLETGIRSSAKFLQGTLVNGLSRFDTNEIVILPVEYGPIARILMVGFTLKAICSRKEFSIYIERTESYQGDGGESIEFITNTFGNPRPMQGDYGTRHSRSVILIDRSVYYWDSDNAVIVESNANGQEQISKGNQYNMGADFRTIAEFFGWDNDNSYPQLALSGYDRANDLLYFSYDYAVSRTAMSPTRVQKTIVFNRQYRKWECFLDLFPEDYGRSGDRLVSFNLGQAWQHNRNNQSFFGVSFVCAIQFPFNEASYLDKTLHGIAVRSVTQPGSTQIISQGTGNNIAQQTFVNHIMWDFYEGKWTSFIPGDFLDPLQSSIFVLARQFDGREMRSGSFDVNIRFVDDLGITITASEITHIDIMYKVSPQ